MDSEPAATRDLRAEVRAALLRDAAACGNAHRARAVAACAAAVGRAPAFSCADGAADALRGAVSERMLQRVAGLAAAAAAGPPSAAAAAEADLATLTGVGASAARRLAAAGVLGVGDLEARLAAGGARGLLTPAQALCVRHARDIAARIPRDEMRRHAATIAAAAAAAGVEAHVVGSYRRGAAESGDVDVLVVSDGGGGLDALLRELARTGYVCGTIARGPRKFMGLGRLPGGAARRVDALCTRRAELPFALLHFTGPAAFNVALRRVARARGLRLSERGWGGGAAAAAAAAPLSEDAVLAALGVAPTPPAARGAALSFLPAAAPGRSASCSRGRATSAA